MFWPFTVWGFLKPNFKPHEYWLSRTRCCNSTYRLRYWNVKALAFWPCSTTLQQYLPFTVLKLKSSHNITSILSVATVLTVYGIETIEVIKSDFLYVFVATVLTVYGIETKWRIFSIRSTSLVATVLTVYGIETTLYFLTEACQLTVCCNSTYRLRYWNRQAEAALMRLRNGCNSTYRLRYWNSIKTYLSSQYLKVATVLTVYGIETNLWMLSLDLKNTWLQQYLPFTVLKRINTLIIIRALNTCVATVLTVYGIETIVKVE